MSIHELTNLLVTITLIEMMATIGLDVTLADLSAVARNARLIANVALANYLCVPAAAVGLLIAFRAEPAVAAGFLILAVCPGAPYGPPLTALAKGDVTAAVGLMAVLAGSSAIVAPLLLFVLLPAVAGEERLALDASELVTTLLATQFLPLCFGLSLRHMFPASAVKAQPPARLAGTVLNVAVVLLILVTQFSVLLEVPARGYLGMLALLSTSLAAGWLFGGPGGDDRKAVTLTTALRNVGLGLVIATGAFPGTPAVTAVLAYGLFEVFATLGIALVWGRRAWAGSNVKERKVPSAS